LAEFFIVNLSKNKLELIAILIENHSTSASARTQEKFSTLIRQESQRNFLYELFSSSLYSIALLH
jgi:hypothetical protein